MHVFQTLCSPVMGIWQGVAADTQKYHPGPPRRTMPYPSMSCGQATPEMALWVFQGRPTHRVGGLQPSSIPLDTPHHTPMPVDLVSAGALMVSQL
jgi:hypothetical protein